MRKDGNNMRKKYNIKALNPRKNPYSKKLKSQVTMNVNDEAINYFKQQSENVGIPYQTLINLYLTDCAKKKRKLNMSWD